MLPVAQEIELACITDTLVRAGAEASQPQSLGRCVGGWWKKYVVAPNHMARSLGQMRIICS